MKLTNYLTDLFNRKRELTITKLVLITSIFFVIFDNNAFFQHVLTIFPLTLHNAGFLASLTVGLTAFIVFLLSIVSSKYTIKPVLISLLLISSLASYFMNNYNVVIDHMMIQNIIETNWAETSDLLNLKLLYYFLFLGALPSLLVYRVKIASSSLKKTIIYKIRDIIIALLVLFAMILSFSKFYTSFFREHKPLRFYTNPTYYIYSAGKYLNRTFSTNNESISPLGLDAQVVGNRDLTKIIILVVGESARADHFSLNGYERETNPHLKQENIINFTKMYSSGTSTAYAVPCMFSIYPRKKFSIEKGNATENILDVLSHTGVIDILWRDNNSDSKGVALRVSYEDYKNPKINPVYSDSECRDEGMLVGLDQYIDQHKGKNLLIILHQMGNHGPAYYKRYPKEFEKFTPVCKTNQVEKCSKEEIINAYDNAILYTDYFLSKAINLLKKYDADHETALIYLSDHGESLGEKGIYLHGLPYFIAPEAQKHIAALMWFGDKMSKNIDINTIKQKKDDELNQDYLFHTLLGLFEVKTSIYQQELDILHATAKRD